MFLAIPSHFKFVLKLAAVVSLPWPGPDRLLLLLNMLDCAWLLAGLGSRKVFICLTRISNKCFKSEIRRVDLTSETPSGWKRLGFLHSNPWPPHPFWEISHTYRFKVIVEVWHRRPQACFSKLWYGCGFKVINNYFIIREAFKKEIRWKFGHCPNR